MKFTDDLTCKVDTNNGECGKPSIIAMIHLGRVTPVCQEHYNVSVVGEVESTRIRYDNCQVCQKGILEYKNVSYDGKNIMVWYKCSLCPEFISFKREIKSNGTIE